MGSSGSDLVGVLDPPQEISRQSEVVHQEQKAIHEAYQSMFRHRTQSVGLRPSRSWGGSQFEHMQDLVAVAEAEEGEEKREDEGSASSQQQPLSIPLSAQEVQGQTGMSPPPYLPPSLSMDFAVTFRRRNRNRKGRKASERHHRVQQTGAGKHTAEECGMEMVVDEGDSSSESNSSEEDMHSTTSSTSSCSESNEEEEEHATQSVIVGGDKQDKLRSTRSMESSLQDDLEPLEVGSVVANRQLSLRGRPRRKSPMQSLASSSSATFKAQSGESRHQASPPLRARSMSGSVRRHVAPVGDFVLQIGGTSMRHAFTLISPDTPQLEIPSSAECSGSDSEASSVDGGHPDAPCSPPQSVLSLSATSPSQADPCASTSLPHRSKPVILVHCAQGVSRSVAVVMAFLMQYRNMSLIDAFNTIKKSRPFIMPNHGFVEQLRCFEASLRSGVPLIPRPRFSMTDVSSSRRATSAASSLTPPSSSQCR